MNVAKPNDCGREPWSQANKDQQGDWNRTQSDAANDPQQQGQITSDAIVIRVNWDRVIIAVLAAALVALLFAEQIPNLLKLTSRRVTSSSAGHHLVAAVRPHDGTAVAPQLAVQSQIQGTDEQLPLGVSVHGSHEGVAVEILGLPSGSALSIGRPLGTSGWRIRAAEAGKAMIRRPPGFAGRIDLVVELRNADDALVEHQSVRRDWLARPAGTAQLASTVVQSGAVIQRASPPSVRLLDFENIVALRKRGEELLFDGDVLNARLLLERAAQAGDAPALIAFGATYDPRVLSLLGIRGVDSDMPTAMRWYDQAKEFLHSDTTSQGSGVLTYLLQRSHRDEATSLRPIDR